ncbi:MAG: DegT/DnrJ/EryC1/StrS family aminotransferase, partial [Bacteroidia bacterium]
FGDISTTSFHATKLFHTVEGGAVITTSAEVLKKMAFMRNFGHNGPEQFADIGINGKNSELHAAMGLVNLNHIDAILERRRELSLHYNKALAGLRVQRPLIHPEAGFNYSYYPIVFETEEQLLKSIAELNLNWIHPRRYFYPSLTQLPYVEQTTMPVCDSVACRVLCLPLYHLLTKEEIDFIARLLLRVQNN